MKNKKMNLKKLSVNSFLTSVKEKDVETIKGGGGPVGGGCSPFLSLTCGSDIANCPISQFNCTAILGTNCSPQTI